MDIYVGNLSRTTTENGLRQKFEEYGSVSSVKIMIDKMTGQPRGFGFVTMQNDTEAETAINALNNYELDGRPLRVNQARPPQPREGGSSGPRSGGSSGGFRSNNYSGGSSSGYRGGNGGGSGGYRGGNDRSY